MGEVEFRLKEFLFLSITDVAVPSVKLSGELSTRPTSTG